MSISSQWRVQWHHIGNFTPPMVGVCTQQKTANTSNQTSIQQQTLQFKQQTLFLRDPVIKHLPAHHWWVHFREDEKGLVVQGPCLWSPLETLCMEKIIRFLSIKNYKIKTILIYKTKKYTYTKFKGLFKIILNGKFWIWLCTWNTSYLSGAPALTVL